MPYADPEKRKECHRKSKKKRYANGLEKAYKLKWRQEHPEEHKIQQRRKHLRGQGWTPGMVEQTLVEQGGRCAICRKAPAGKAILHADHNHATGEPRALLCGNCNHAIGMLKESPETCRAAAEYLEAWA
jgi:hypothetical protein